ncbi:MAG: N-acetylmuramoyl-L-alanine amidase [Coriobacteriia bacterium]
MRRYLATVAVLLIASLVTAPDALAATIVVDPGHGGPYSNSNHFGLREEHVNLAIARELARELRARGHTVVLTRDHDTALSLRDLPTWHWDSGWRLFPDGIVRVRQGVPTDDLQARVDVANRIGADLFICVHNNGGRPSARGTETYAARRDPLGRRLAADVQAAVAAGVGTRNRGAFARDFYVVRWADMPAALVECGFVSNRADARLLASAAWRARFARAIAGGVTRFLARRPFSERLPRIGGEGAAGTAAALARSGWPEGARTVILASADGTAALDAPTLSRALDAPLLYTSGGALPTATAAALAAIAPTEVVAIGSEGSLPATLLAEAAGVAGAHASRIAAGDAFSAVTGRVRALVVASGDDTRTALAAAAAAADLRAPLLLCAGGSLPASATAFVSRHRREVTLTVVVGDETAVSAATAATLPAALRIVGSDAFETRMALFDLLGRPGALSPLVASARDVPTALAAACYAGKTGRPLLLVDGRALPGRLREWLGLNASRVTGPTLVGGVATLPPSVGWALAKALGR